MDIEIAIGYLLIRQNNIDVEDNLLFGLCVINKVEAWRFQR